MVAVSPAPTFHGNRLIFGGKLIFFADENRRNSAYASSGWLVSGSDARQPSTVQTPREAWPGYGAGQAK
jgi:hypothetical protein